MFNNLYKGKKIFGLYIGFSIILLNGFALILDLQKVNTFIILPSIFILGLSFNIDYLKEVSVEYILLLLIFIFGLISSFQTDIHIETFFRDLSMSVGVLVSAFIPLVVNFKRNYYLFFFASFFLSFFIIIFFMYSSGNLEEGLMDYSDRRRFILNANEYSYIAFFGNFSLFYIHQLYKRKIIALLLIIYSLISIYVSFITASRSGLLFGILINFLYWSWIFKPQFNKWSYKILVFIIILFLFSKLYGIYQSSYINQRVEYSLEHGDSRQGLAEEAINVFILNPFLGVGPGQFIHYSISGSYSHNSFTEIAVTQGIVGLILLLFLFYLIIHEVIIYYKYSQENITFWKLNLFFYSMFFLYNFLYPFYKYTYPMMFLFLIISFQKNMIKSYN